MSENTINETNQTHPRKKPARRGKLIKRVILLTLSAVILAAGVVIYLAKSEPAYWKQHEKFLAETTPQRMEELAGQVEDKLKMLANLGIDENDPATQTLRELTGQGTGTQTTAEGVVETTEYKIKPEDVHINTEQTITFDNDQLAAVVQLRMDEWMLERGYVKPNEIEDPMIAVEDENLVMAFKLKAGKFDAVISGKFDLTILENGMAVLTLKRFLVGKLPVPADSLGEHLRRQSGGDPRAEKVGEWLGKLQELEVKPVIELEHRRRARVMAYKILKDGLEMTVRIQDHKTYKEMNGALAGVPVD
jgi:hypothetical protein